MGAHSNLVTTRNAVAETLCDPGDFNQTLIHISNAPKLNIPGADFTSISCRHGDDQLETLASTHPLTVKLDTLQYELARDPAMRP